MATVLKKVCKLFLLNNWSVSHPKYYILLLYDELRHIKYGGVKISEAAIVSRYNNL